MGEPITFQIIDWSQFHESVELEPTDELEEENGGGELLHYKIRLFGRTDKGKSIYVNVDNFTPYFYVEIPTDWNQTKAYSLVNYIKGKITNPIVLKGFKNFDIVERKKFYGFTGYKVFKFLRLIFLNMKSFKAFEYWIDKNKIIYPFLFKKPTKLTIYESNIEPFIRCMHIRKLSACGWVSVKKYESYEEGTSYCDVAIKTDWTELNPHDSSSIQKFIVASYDIECMSESGDFPIATNDNDPIIQIGTVFSYYGESEPFFKSIITLGGCAKVKGLEDVEIQSYPDEKKVLLAWTKLIQKYDPDIITGYNINGFDFQYMKDRAEKHKILKKFNQLSRVQGEESEYKVKQLASSALGENILKYFDMNGRVIIDLMKVAMRDFKLDSFKLDNVASTFIREKIEGYKEMDKSKSYVTTKSVYGIKEEDYVNIMWDDGLTENKHDQKYKILQIIKDETDPKLYRIVLNGTIPDEAFYTEKHGGTTKKKNKTFWCHAKDDVSAKDLFKFQRGSDEDRGIIAKYCIMDCVLVTKLMEKTQVLNNNIGMANVCSVPLTYIFMRGQGVKIFSLVSKKCRELEHIMPRLKVKQKENPDDKFKKIKKNGDDSSDDEDENTGYEGAIVFPPVKGVHYEPIPVLDYASLYPRSMILVNISQECFVMEPKYDNLDGYDYQTVTYNNNDGTTTTCRFAKKLDGTKGILPLILIELLDKRSSTKKLMEKAAAAGDNFAAAIYDGLQLAYKVTANSLYGQVGAPTSPIYMKELAASTTATGRKMLELSKEFIEGPFGNLINYALEDKDEYDKYALQVFDKDVYHKRPIQAKKWSEPKAGRNTKEEFIDYFYKKVLELIEPTYRVKPQVIYGDSVTGDTPILIKDNRDRVKFISIEYLGEEWTDYSVFKSEDPNLTEKEQDSTINFSVWTDKGWVKVVRVIRHKTYKKIYEVITPKGYIKVTSDHSLLDPELNQIKPDECKLGQELLHNDMFENNYTKDKIIDNFMICYNHWNGCTDSEGNHFIEAEYQEDALQTYYWAKLMGYYPIIQKKLDSFRIMCFVSNEYPDPTTIIEINDLGYIEDYVYDLETEIGRFHAGIGSLVVKNTDSVFFSPKIHDIETKQIRTDRDVLPICIEIGMLAGSTICKILPEPEEQVYEKTLWPFIILAKKKYVGNLYEDDDKVFKQKSMGIVLKRRDNAKIVKIVVGGIVDYILNGKPGETCVQDRNKGAIEYTRLLIKKILRGEFPIDKFVISKTLRSTYKNRSAIVHAVLADRIGERDPGNKPDVNERVPFVYIVPKGKVNLQGDRVEDPKYVLEKKLDLDYLFYITNQIMKPSIQFLEQIAMNPEKLFENYINKEINRRKNVSSVLEYVCIEDGENNLNAGSKKSSRSDKSDKSDKSDDQDDESVDYKSKSIKKNKSTKSKSNLSDNSTQELLDDLDSDNSENSDNSESEKPKSKKKLSDAKGKTKSNKSTKSDKKDDDEKINKSTKTTKSNKSTKVSKTTKQSKLDKEEESSSSSDEEIKKRKQSNKSIRKSLTIEF
jgi:DNA polymerase elongation subunit (family B)